MKTRSPLTVVHAPVPSRMNRKALDVCRCAWAVSPGRMICSPAYRVVTVAGGSVRPGLTSMSTRRSASSSDSVCEKCSSWGRRSFQLHR